jgi:hypothetical protein
MSLKKWRRFPVGRSKPKNAVTRRATTQFSMLVINLGRGQAGTECIQ